LGHRVDDGRDPPRPRRDRPGPRAQDRGLLPRPSRRRHGVGTPDARRAPPPARPPRCCCRPPPPPAPLAPRDEPGSVPFGGGKPKAVTDLTKAIAFNYDDSLERGPDDNARWRVPLNLESA